MGSVSQIGAIGPLERGRRRVWGLIPFFAIACAAILLLGARVSWPVVTQIGMDRGSLRGRGGVPPRRSLSLRKGERESLRLDETAKAL